MMAAAASRLSALKFAAKPWQTNLTLVLLGTCLLLLTRQFVSEYDHFTIGFSGVSSWSAVIYVAAALVILSQPVDRYTFPIILTFAISCRLVTLFPEPYASSDIYRYVWDGIVQHAHISPYRYVPADPALKFLRAPAGDTYDMINRKDYAHTIYPPAAQFLFYLVTFISPTVTFMKTVMVLFEGLTLWALVALLKHFNIRREQTLLFAWCPLAIWEFSGSGHLDAAAMAFITLALLARYRRQAVLTGLFLGMAIMIKFYPLVLFPALFRRGEYKMPATVAAVIAVGYACYSSVGMAVFGFLGGYAKEEGIDSGTRYFLLDLAQRVPGLHKLPAGVFLAFAALVFSALIVWCWRTCCTTTQPKLPSQQTLLFGLPANADFIAPAFAFALVMMLLFSPHYPWYIAWLIPFLALLPNLTVFTYVCAMFYLCTTAIAVGYGPQQFLLNEILYGCTFAGFLLELVLRRWPIHRPYLHPATAGPA